MRSHVWQAGWIEAGVVVATTTHARHHHARARGNAAPSPRQHTHTHEPTHTGPIGHPTRPARRSVEVVVGMPAPSSSRAMSIAVASLAGAAQNVPRDRWLEEATRPGALIDQVRPGTWGLENLERKCFACPFVTEYCCYAELHAMSVCRAYLRRITSRVSFQLSIGRERRTTNPWRCNHEATIEWPFIPTWWNEQG